MDTDLTVLSVDIDGVRMAYWDTNAAASAGRTVVYVHGNTGGKIWFSRVMAPPVPPGVRVVAPDLPNFGESDHLDGADIDLYARYLSAFLERVDIRHAVVVGHSLGGAVVTAAAGRAIDRISRLVLVDPAPLDGLVTPEEYYPVIEQYRHDRTLMAHALAAVTPTMDDPALLEELTDTALRMNPLAFSGNPRALSRMDLRDAAAEIACPVLVVRGDRDRLITEEMASATAAGFPMGMYRRLEGVGHSVMVEDPPRFLEIIAEVTGAPGATDAVDG